MNPRDKHYFCQLVLKFKDQTITDEEQLRLDKALREEPENCELLMQVVEVYTRLMRSEAIAAPASNGLNFAADEMLHQFSEWENVAPSVIAEEASPADRPLIRKVVREKNTYHMNKTSAVMALLSMAAVLFIVVFFRFAPARSMEVATLTNSMDAVFVNSENPTVGGRLSCHVRPLWLQKGVIEITFDYGASVVIEGPAQFQLNTAENIALYSGRLYAHVPGHSKGFIVETTSSRVIDLGTEFGVRVDFDGSSAVYMIKGKARVFSGTKGQTGEGEILTAGQARRVDRRGAIETISMREDEFARQCLSHLGVVWRGEAVDLADIVGGGSGLGDGQLQNSIDPLTGAMGSWKVSPNRQGGGVYVSVADSKLIDGVFVPDGGDGPIQVTSANHLWHAPDTSSMFKYNIVNSLRIPANLAGYADYVETPGRPKEDMLLAEAATERIPVRGLGLMGGGTVPTPSDSSIFLHSNLGITFDLEAIRRVLPNEGIKAFTCTFGIGEITSNSGQILDVWILVDGQARFERQGVSSSMVLDIAVELSRTDRFLTLVVTDGGDHAFSFDWGLFMNPRLELE
jgi:hypothetical protein